MKKKEFIPFIALLLNIGVALFCLYLYNLKFFLPKDENGNPILSLEMLSILEFVFYLNPLSILFFQLLTLGTMFFTKRVWLRIALIVITIFLFFFIGYVKMKCNPW